MKNLSVYCPVDQAQILVVKHYDEVVSMIHDIIKNTSSRKRELVQEIYCKILGAISSYDQSRACLSTFICTVAKQHYLNLLEYNKLRDNKASLDFDVPDKESSFDTDSLNLATQLLNNLDLTNKEDMIIKLRFVDNLTLKEIAERLGNVSITEVHRSCCRWLDRKKSSFGIETPKKVPGVAYSLGSVVCVNSTL